MLFLFSISWGLVSGWWALGCLFLGILYAWLLYRLPAHHSKKATYLLAALRTFSITLIALLLLSLLLKTVNSRREKPLVLVVQDNSSSISLFKPAGFDATQFVARLALLKTNLRNDFDVREFNFSNELHDGLSTKFTGKQTDISAAIRGLTDRFANQNIGALVLATDGIYNKGSSPQYLAPNLKTSIYTIALGDTIPRRDLLIANVNYNKTAFLDNNFEIEVLAGAYQSKGENLRLQVSEDGKPVSGQTIPIPSNDFRKAVTLKLHADKKGVHKFTINIPAVSNETSLTNNTETIYVEVLDTRQKILLLYNSPHPDISAIKLSLESNRNYEVKTSLVTAADAAKLDAYSLIILYQLPAAGTDIPLLLQNQLNKLKTPLWYILGAQSNIAQINHLQKIIQINPGRAEMQEVFAVTKADFSAFNLSDSARRELSMLPPLIAPFGNYSAPAAQSVLLKQKIGSVETSYPLLAFGEEAGIRTAVLTAEGLWKWRLAEHAANGNYHSIDELLSQSVQYLTARGNSNRFRVYTARNVFDENEPVILNAELYNDALQLINTPDVKIDLKSKTGKTYSFIFSRSGQSYQLDAGSLPPDEYVYSASTKPGAKVLNANGQFAVKALNAETRQSAADHQLLYSLAKANGGQMLMPSQISRLADLIRKNENIKTVVYDDKTYKDLIDEKWVFVLILALLSTEWFLRKQDGEI